MSELHVIWIIFQWSCYKTHTKCSVKSQHCQKQARYDRNKSQTEEPYSLLVCGCQRSLTFLSGLWVNSLNGERAEFRISGSSIWLLASYDSYGIILNYLMKTPVLLLALLRFSSTISANLVGYPWQESPSSGVSGSAQKQRGRLCQASWSSLAEASTRSPRQTASPEHFHIHSPRGGPLLEDKRKVDR